MSAVASAPNTQGDTPPSPPPSAQTAAITPTTRESYDACASLVRRAAKNFYMGLRLATKSQRSALYAIYAWMRTADDIVDGPAPPDQRDEQLTAFHRDTVAALTTADIPERHAWLWPAIKQTANGYPINPISFTTTINAMRADINADRHAIESNAPTVMFDTWSELEAYCEGVAGMPGGMCVAIWGTTNSADAHAVRTLALRRGFAFQITNIARDIHYDATKGRVYAPRELLDLHGLNPQQLTQQQPSPASRAALHELVARARGAYLGSQSLDALIAPSGRRALAGLTRTYTALLDQIDADPDAVFKGKVRIPRSKKLAIATRAALRL